MAPSQSRGHGLTHVLVLTAVDLEVRGLARHLGLTRVSGPPWAHYRGGVLEVVGIGLRGAHLAERLAHRPSPSLIVSAGACGALAPDLVPGGLVVPEVVIGPEGERHSTAATAGLAREGCLLSTGELVATPAAKARLWMQTGARAVDMESATIVQWARGRGVAVAVVRAVADTARDVLPADLAAVVEPGGRLRAGRALRAVLARPRAAADALALGRNTETALRAVAAALGRMARALGPA
jgi:adenosylhomocysteine nucleosidase